LLGALFFKKALAKVGGIYFTSTLINSPDKYISQGGKATMLKLFNLMRLKINLLD